MSLTPAKQIKKFMSSFVGLSGLAAVGGAFDDITASLTTVLQTAGDGGLLVPLQVASMSRSAPTMGVIADALNNVGDPLRRHLERRPDGRQRSRRLRSRGPWRAPCGR